MIKSIHLHPRYGVNPTIPQCFWCGKDKNEIAMLGAAYKTEAPRTGLVLDYAPCEECRNRFLLGIHVIEVMPADKQHPALASGMAPTGRYLIIKRAAVERMGLTPPELKAQVLSKGVMMVEAELFNRFNDEGNGPETKEL